MASPEITLIIPSSAQEWQATHEILRDYQASLDVNLDFQHFEAELADLPGAYAPPTGVMLLALIDGAVAGCGGFRNLPDADDANACEMKRLFVRPVFRRFGLGRMLALDLIDRALVAGYSAVLLDTLDEMEAARGLYASLGFEEVPPFYFNPLPGARYLRLDLNANHDR
jgi:GNAT superfamily N-acetyltransferase